MGVGTPINKKDLQELLKETTETTAVEVKIDNNNRSFRVVDLWNLQKRRKTTASMSRWL